MSGFKAKMHQIRFPLGLRPRPSSGSLQRGRDGKGEREGKGREGKGKGRVGEGMGGKGWPPIGESRDGNGSSFVTYDPCDPSHS